MSKRSDFAAFFERAYNSEIESQHSRTEKLALDNDNAQRLHDELSRALDEAKASIGKASLKIIEHMGDTEINGKTKRRHSLNDLMTGQTILEFDAQGDGIRIKSGSSKLPKRDYATVAELIPDLAASLGRYAAMRSRGGGRGS